MAEYIEREAAVEAAKHAWGKGLEPTQYIEIIPAADVAPVRHGRWVWTQGVCEDDYNLNCSSCGSPCPGNYDDEDETYRYHRYPYCPNCGCKMDLEEQEITNADMIRAMSDEELAENLMCPNEMGIADIPCDKSDQCNCYKCLLDWLRQSAVEEAR